MMKRLVLTLLFVCMPMFLMYSGNISDKGSRLKPVWIKKTPVSPMPAIEFIPVVVYSQDYKTIGARAMHALGQNLPSNATVSSKTGLLDNDAVYSSDQSGAFKAIVNEQEKDIYYTLVDSYSILDQGNIKYHALYQVNMDDKKEFLRTHVTEKYSPALALMSIIPGVGQFYKGDPLKGCLFLGGCAACGTGIIFMEMQRKTYVAQIGQTHDINVIKQLDARQKNLAIARNVVLGATAAVYIWNIIDAAIAPGARHVTFSGNGIQYRF